MSSLPKARSVFLHAGFDGFGGGDVHLGAGDFAEGGELRAGGVERGGVHIPEADGGAGLEKTPGDGEADAARAACDDGLAAGELDLIHGRQ